MRPSLHFDVVVIGAGVAGLTAATRLAQSGARVCVLAKGVGPRTLRRVLVDVLGYDPERVSSPAEALPSFVEAHPEHPYAAIGLDGIGAALEWFGGVVEAGPQPVLSLRGRPRTQPRPADGARRQAPVRARPRDVCARAISSPDAARRRDRSAWSGSACCATSTRRCARPISSATASRRGGCSSSSMWAARRPTRSGSRRCMDDHKFRASFAAQLLPLLHADERVGVAGHPRASRPAWSVVRAREPARARRVRDPDAAALGFRDPRLRRVARGAARGRRPAGDRRTLWSRSSARATA